MIKKNYNWKRQIINRTDFEARVQLELGFLMKDISGMANGSWILNGLDNCEANYGSPESSRVRHEIQCLYQYQQSILHELAEIDIDHENDWKNEAKHLERLNDNLDPSYRYVLYLRVNVWLLQQEHRDVIERKAREIIGQDLVLSHLCRELRSVPDDANAIAKVITPLLIDLVDSTMLAIPRIPNLFAAIALAIANNGIFNLCAHISNVTSF
jgi:hypothetical protein